MTNKLFQSFLSTFTDKRVGVLGDFLLDEYIIGNSSRVSREAPIVVIDYIESIYHPGGAANAAQNITSYGAKALAFGVLGDDREGTSLSHLLSEKGVQVDGLAVDAAASTSVKLRIMSGELNAQKQQVARVDRNHKVNLHSDLMESMKKKLVAAVDECDAFLISDYGMGMVPSDLSRVVIDSANKKGIPVVVDSRFSLNAFSGATVATPNEVEAMALLDLKQESQLTNPETVARLVEESGIRGFIVTRGSKGMLIHDGQGTTESIGIVGSDEATDVTGAGDTVSATIALALSSGTSMVQAAQMATFAAAVVVMKRGTATAAPAELEELIRKYPITSDKL